MQTLRKTDVTDTFSARGAEASPLFRPSDLFRMPILLPSFSTGSGRGRCSPGTVEDSHGCLSEATCPSVHCAARGGYLLCEINNENFPA